MRETSPVVFICPFSAEDHHSAGIEHRARQKDVRDCKS